MGSAEVGVSKIIFITIHQQLDRELTTVVLTGLRQLGGLGDVLAATHQLDFGDIHLLTTPNAQLETRDRFPTQGRMLDFD